MDDEAIETAAQTKAEAAKGDQQAIRKLARTQAPKHTQSTEQHVDSAKGKLNATA